jgi:hypothetical protein
MVLYMEYPPDSKRRGGLGPPLLKQLLLLLVDLHDLTASIKPAGFARPMGELKSAAVGALDQSGSGELPVAAAPLVASGAAYFTLRDCHDDTSSLHRCF